MSGERIHLSLDDETATILEEMEEHIDNNFGGTSAFFRTMIKDYSKEGAAQAQVSAIKRKIRKKEDELEYLEKELKLWQEQLKKEKKESKQENVEQKVQDLKAEKKDLRDQIKTEEQLRKEGRPKFKERADRYGWNEEEMQEKLDDWVSRKKARNQDKRDEIRELETKIEKLENKEVEVQ